MVTLRIVAGACALVPPAAVGIARVNVFECESRPEDAGWTPGTITCNPSQWNSGGWYFQHVNLCPGFPPPGGQSALYRRSLSTFPAMHTFYLEWRAETDAPSGELEFGGGIVIAAASSGTTRYTLNIVRDRVRMIRDNRLPILFAPLTPGVAHRFRLELVEDISYSLYIDNQLVETGVPEGPYPDPLLPEIVWRARAAYAGNTTRWDYIRYGVIPHDAGGDYDSDDDIDLFDAHYFFECFDGMPDELAAGITRGPQRPSGPGCRWADMDSDGDTDLLDFAQFSARYTGKQLTPEEVRPATP